MTSQMTPHTAIWKKKKRFAVSKHTLDEKSSSGHDCAYPEKENSHKSSRRPMHLTHSLYERSYHL